MRAASASVSSASRTLAWMMANSSPPSRATTSPWRTQASSRVLTCFSSASPTGMAERVVDALEAVEVEAEHGEALAAPQALQRLLQLLAEQGAVGEVGERVVARKVGDLLLLAAALGDVLVERHPASAFERLGGDGDDAVVAVLDRHGRRA